jgi:hypothetical protein
LRQWNGIASESILGHQQPPREPLMGFVEAIAGSRLPHLQLQNQRITMQG